MVRSSRLVAGAALWAACRPAPDVPEVDPWSSSTATLTVPASIAAYSPEACPAAEPWDGHGFDPGYAPLASGDDLRDVAWYLLTALGSDAALAAAAGDDLVLSTLGEEERADLALARTCAGDSACVRERLVWTPDQDSAAIAALAPLADDLFARHLDPAGAFAVDAEAPDRLAEAYERTSATLAAAFDAYAGALDPAGLDAVVAGVSSAVDAPWFEPLASVTTAAMEALGRDEAVRYEPIALGENAAAAARLADAAFDWADWPFALIVVPGYGPSDLETPLDPLGAARCDLAIVRYRAGLAPFVLVSGGHVHPDETPYSEAIEMKRYLMERWALPEDAILVDPYARHTTTNLRNAARTALRLGAPPDQALLVTTDAFQAAYIQLLGPRCDDELGYRPWRGLGRLSSEDGCFVPHADALTRGPEDPLDP